MADGDGEGVGRVVRLRYLGQAEDRAHHALHLRLLGAAVPADGALHGRRGVLSAADPRGRAGDERGAARLPDEERDTGVGADVGLLEHDHLRLVAGDEVGDLVVDPLQPQLRPLAGRSRPPAVVDGLEAASACMDDAVTARCCARVDTENLHVARLGGGPDVPPSKRELGGAWTVQGL